MNLYDTSLPIIKIDSSQLYKRYKQIGFGQEAGVYQYDESTAIKIFQFFKNKSRLPLKFRKIEIFGKMEDESFLFPKGLVGFETEQKEGYFCDLNLPYRPAPDFDKLQFLKDRKKILEFIMKADKAIRRIHSKGFIIGDIKADNILINRDEEVKFCDVDNYMYGDFGFDLEPGRRGWLSRTYDGKNFSNLDNEKFVFAMMALQYFIDGTVLSIHASDYYFKNLIEFLDVDPVIKDGLRIIFSDAENKPYIGDVLKGFDPESKIISLNAIYRINRIF